MLFRELSAREKVELLFDMCNWRLELEDAMELTKVLILFIICFLSCYKTYLFFYHNIINEI